VEKGGDSLLINPGEVMRRFGKSSFAWYDTEANQAEIVQVT
jgi:predicted phosphodiesterase